MSACETIFSPDRLYRYTLWREWDSELELEEREGNRSHQYVQFIGLNPSTADETQDDPTIRRCIQFAKDWGFGALCMTNLFAWRDTVPKNMKAAAEPIGAENNEHLYRLAEKAGLVVCAWGRDGAFKDRGAFVKANLSGVAKLHHLGLNDDGTPKHPLYLRAETKPTLWAPAEVKILGFGATCRV